MVKPQEKQSHVSVSTDFLSYLLTRTAGRRRNRILMKMFCQSFDILTRKHDFRDSTFLTCCRTCRTSYLDKNLEHHLKAYSTQKSTMWFWLYAGIGEERDHTNFKHKVNRSVMWRKLQGKGEGNLFLYQQNTVAAVHVFSENSLWLIFLSHKRIQEAHM